jgi:ferrous iron transport protein A
VVLTLGTVASGARVRVVRVRGGRGLVHRLAAVGLVPGCELTVTRSRAPAIVSMGGARIAVGRHAAMAVEVEEVAA